MAPGSANVELLAPVAAPSRLVARAALTIGEVRAPATRSGNERVMQRLQGQLARGASYGFRGSCHLKKHKMER